MVGTVGASERVTLAVPLSPVPARNPPQSFQTLFELSPRLEGYPWAPPGRARRAPLPLGALEWTAEATVLYCNPDLGSEFFLLRTMV